MRLAPEHPRTLAALRISVTAILLLSPETHAAERLAAMPAALRTPPEGLVWAASAIPITPALAHAAHLTLVTSAVAGLIGLCSRTALALVTLSGLYVLGLYQLTGSVTHDMHLLWFSALCAAGPSGKAFSVDRLLAARRGAPPEAPSLDAAVPLLFSRLLLGMVYFFPGFWKLRTSGLAWITTDNLKNQIEWKWFENGVLPPLRIDRFDGLLHAGALGVVLLELAFPLLVLFPRTRLAAAVGGFAFHVFTQIFLFIPFVSLWGCYTMLVDFERGRALRLSRISEFFTGREKVGKGVLVGNNQRNLPSFPPSCSISEPGHRSGTAVFSVVLGVLLVAGVAIQGARNRMQAWPFACYPTFQWRVDSTIPDLVLEAVRADGTTALLPDGPGGGGHRTPDDWGMAWRVAGLYGETASPERLHAYLAHALQKPGMAEALRNAVRVRFYRAGYSVRPEDWGKAPLRAERLAELRL